MRSGGLDFRVKINASAAPRYHRAPMTQAGFDPKHPLRAPAVDITSGTAIFSRWGNACCDFS